MVKYWYETDLWLEAGCTMVPCLWLNRLYFNVIGPRPLTSFRKAISLLSSQPKDLKFQSKKGYCSVRFCYFLTMRLKRMHQCIGPSNWSIPWSNHLVFSFIRYLLITIYLLFPTYTVYKKHHPPMLNDEVWRLEKIGKDGAFHKKLASENINTVQDLLKLSIVDPQKLRTVC